MINSCTYVLILVFLKYKVEKQNKTYDWPMSSFLNNHNICCAEVSSKIAIVHHVGNLIRTGSKQLKRDSGSP